MVARVSREEGTKRKKGFVILFSGNCLSHTIRHAQTQCTVHGRMEWKWKYRMDQAD